MIEQDVLAIDFSRSQEITDVSKLIEKYADVPMGFANARLVRMSERHENSITFTVDSDFMIYRKNGKQEILLIIASEESSFFGT